MKSYQGMHYPAMEIEHALAPFLGNQIGNRGGVNDADVFRGGNRGELAKVVEEIASSMDSRVKRVNFTVDEAKPGGAKMKIEGCLDALKETAKALKNDGGKEPEDYHWLLIGNLVMAIDGILEHFGI